MTILAYFELGVKLRSKKAPQVDQAVNKNLLCPKSAHILLLIFKNKKNQNANLNFWQKIKKNKLSFSTSCIDIFFEDLSKCRFIANHLRTQLSLWPRKRKAICADFKADERAINFDRRRKQFMKKFFYLFFLVGKLCFESVKKNGRFELRTNKYMHFLFQFYGFHFD